MEGRRTIVVSLLEAAEPVDTGAVWAKRSFTLGGHELHDEINAALFTVELELLDFAVARCGTVVPTPQPETGASYRRRRTPEDSRIDIDQPLRSQFPILQVADPERFPAFFEKDGFVYEVILRRAPGHDGDRTMTSPAITIDGRPIGLEHPPYVICELSANHNGSLERALELLDAAAATGANAIKIQTYTPDTLTIDHDGSDFRIRGGLWDGQTLYELYQTAFTPYEWHAALVERARRLGVTLFSTPFDETAVALLSGLGMPAYKIASFEAVDLSLIARVAAEGKPMIISTGMADRAEIGEAVEAARAGGAGDLVLLHCVSLLSGPLRASEPTHDPRPRGVLRGDRGALGSHAGHRMRGGRGGARRMRDREALHPRPQRGRAGCCLQPRTRRVLSPRPRVPRRLAVARRARLRSL